MKKVNLLAVIMILFLGSSIVFSQSESAVKKTKAAVEKNISHDSGKTLKTVKSKISSVKTGAKKESCETMVGDACCSEGKKEMKASISHKYGTDCGCDNCRTASAEMKSLKNAHGDSCDCEGCMTASVESVKKHQKDCSCKNCAKT
jgi:hypothetical protein